MEKVKEIELLQSLKGDTYFAELFGDQQIDVMCENIKNDHPIELGLNLFEGSSVAKENAELKKQLTCCQERENTVAEDLLIKANEQSEGSLADLAEYLIGSKKCLAIKLRLELYLTGDDRVALINLLAK